MGILEPSGGTGIAFVKFHGESVPLETHKVRIVQKLNLLPVD
jgi:hypothetical protein